MTTLKYYLLKKVIPRVYAVFFIIALLLISSLLERRHIYF